MTVKIALINMKGGVGKSTITANLAWQFAAFARWSKRVLVVDLDPQFNASQYLLGVKRYESLVKSNAKTVWDVLESVTVTPGGGRPDPVEPEDAIVTIRKLSKGGRIDLLPSRLELAWSLRQPAFKERLLAKFVAKVEADYDVILIDCAPTESLLTTAAYFVADHVLVPVRPEYLSSIGLPLLARSIDEFEQQNDDQTVGVLGIVFNATTDYSPEELIAKKEVRAFANNQGWPVFDEEVRYSRSYPKSARETKPIFWTSYARRKVASEFHQFAKAVALEVGL